MDAQANRQTCTFANNATPTAAKLRAAQADRLRFETLARQGFDVFASLSEARRLERLAVAESGSQP